MKQFITGLIIAIGLVMSVPAQADDSGLVTFKIMKLETVLKLAKTALDDCRGRGYQVAVTVVDRFGLVQVALRDRFAGPHTPETSRRKAWTAASFRTDTLEFGELSQAGSTLSGLREISDVVAVGGGIPVEAGGSVIGGIGVSGAPGGEADHACAKVGISEIALDIEF